MLTQDEVNEALDKRSNSFDREQLNDLADNLEQYIVEIRRRASVAGINKPSQSPLDKQQETWRSQVLNLLLEKIGRDLYPKGHDGKPVSSIALRREILGCALANWDKLEPYYRLETKYAHAEDLHLVDYWASKQRQQIFFRKKKPKAK